MSATSLDAPSPARPMGRARRLWRIVTARRPPWFSILVLVCMLMALVAPELLAPHDPMKQSLLVRLRPPAWMEGGSWTYPLGTDSLGRDLLSRIIYGTQTSLSAAGLTLLVGGFIGVAAGLLSGYVGGRIEAVLMRLADATLAFPVILFAFLLAITLGPGMVTVVIAVSMEIWARFARVIRSEVIGLRDRNFVKLARVAGCSPAYILRVHIFPNIVNTLVVLITLQVGWVVIMEASLSFLGAGIPPPTPAWGSMIAEGRQTLMRAWWTAVMPGMALLLTVLAFNLLGDWLRDLLDPKQRTV